MFSKGVLVNIEQSTDLGLSEIGIDHAFAEVMRLIVIIQLQQLPKDL